MSGHNRLTMNTRPNNNNHKLPALAGKSPDLATLWLALRQSATQPSVWFALARAYAKQRLIWQAGYASRQALRLDPSLRSKLKALDIGDWQDATAGDALLGRETLPNAADLAARFELQVQASPGDWLTWLYLARLQDMVSTPAADATHGALNQAQSLEPLSGESLHWLGVWRLNGGNAAGAVSAFTGLLNIQPMRHGSMMYLGEALMRIGNLAAAEKAFARASQSNNPDFLQTLSSRVFAHNYWAEATEILKKALSLRPTDVAMLMALAKIHLEVYELSEAQVCCQQVLKKEPGNKEATYMLASLPGRMGDARGQLVRARAEYAEADAPLSRLASNIAMTSLYHDEMAASEVADLHRRLCAPIEAAVASAAAPGTPVSSPAYDKSPQRRLRIGCVTGDLHRQHPVNIFMLPLLQRFDHTRFEICIYHTGTMHDEYTRQAKACADRWLEASTLDDAALQQAIVADAIDILLDLAGHTASHRLGVFAMRGAPVQATFLGYPHSTGLSSIDWLVGDATVSPTEHAPLFSEGLAQLPHSVFCWAPVDEYPLPPARRANAPVVFGSFNNAMKLNPTTIALWARVLQAVPGSTLLLKAPSLRDAAVQARFSNLFAHAGIAPERLTFRGPTGLAVMMQEYGDIDIALDPTPYNGGTTTLQALWMGLPVVCLMGGNFVSRMGASFLRTLQRPEWLADDEAGYVAAAVRLAQACGEGGSLRASRPMLRQQMATSPLCDIKAYSENFEALLRTMWVAHCSGDERRVIRPS
jgi:protein O-GlcNAc transferase